MSHRTSFLARLIGLYCLLAGLIMVVHREGMIAAVEGLVRPRGDIGEASIRVHGIRTADLARAPLQCPAPHSALHPPA